MLNKLSFGSETARTPILIVHGLYGSARNWGAVAKRLSEDRHITAVDVRNHGESPWHTTHSYEELATDLVELIDAPVDVIGHSMGGKAAIVLALNHPDKVRRLVVADIAPVEYTHSQLPMIEAMRKVDLSRVTVRRDADAQLSLYVDDPSVRAFLLQSLDVKAQKWRLNLTALEAEMPKITGFPRLSGPFENPTLFLSGSESDYVRQEHRPVIKELFSDARFAKLKGAGHWLHAEKPREFESAVRMFLDA